MSLRIAFAACHHAGVHPQQPGWLTVAAQAPDVLLLLGDNVYLENDLTEVLLPWRRPRRWSLSDFVQRLHACYARQAAVPAFRQALRASSKVLGTFDDHDFLGNDAYAGEHPELAGHARMARQLLRQFLTFCNTRPLPEAYPSAPGLDAPEPVGDAPGVACAIDLRDVRVIVLDNRSFRHQPASQAACLGKVQLDWLAAQLNGPQRLTVVATGSTLSASPRCWVRGEPLVRHAEEMGRLRGLYRDAVRGRGQVLVHLGGDLHHNAHWHHEDFLEVASSGLGSGWQPFASRQKGNAGMLTWPVDAGSVRVQTWGSEPRCNIDLCWPSQRI